MNTTLTRRPSLKINALSNWGGLGVNILIGFLLTPAILNHLGEKRFGIWMLVSSIVGYFGLLQLGVGTAVLRYVPLYQAQQDKEKVSAIVSTGMAFFSAVGFLIFILTFVFGGQIAAYFKGGEDLKLLIQLVGLASALECPSLIFDAAIRGYENFVLVNLLGIFTSIVRGAGIATCIFMDYGLKAMGWTLVIVSFVSLLTKGLAFKYRCRDAKLSLRKADLLMLKSLLFYGSMIMVGGAGGLLRTQSSKLVVGKMISLEAVGILGVFVLLMRYYQSLIWALTKVLMPRFSYLSGRDADEQMTTLFFRSTRYATIISGCFALLLWITGPAFLRLWTKNTNISNSIAPLIILTTGMLVSLSHRTGVELLYGLGKQKQEAVFSLLEGIFVLIFSLLLSRKIGLSGAAIGMALPLLVVRGLIQPLYVCALLKVGFWQYYRKCILKPWTVTALLVTTSYLLGISHIAYNWLTLFVVSGLIAAVYYLLTLAVSLNRAERKTIMSYAPVRFQI